MAQNVFDVSFLANKNRGPKQDYGFLVDQLSIKENQLQSDGKLSPGDYDLLMKEARKLYTHPGLTPAQRSNIEVKISGYDEAKKTTTLKTKNDIGRLNRESQDDSAKQTMLFANNPSALLQSKADQQRAKIENLAESIDQLSQAGDDASNHLQEYQQAVVDYQDILQAQDDVTNYKPGTPPTSNFVAYLTTNSRGEIQDVQIGRTSSKTGYVQTNGLYAGLQIYGKVNRKENNRNVFQLGNESFSAPDLLMPDPANPGAMKAAVLVADSQKKTLGRNFETATAGQFYDVNTATLRSQVGLRPGDWAEGEKGVLYQKQQDGKYLKYVNAKKEDIGAVDPIRVPRSMEASFLPETTQTIDGSALPKNTMATPPSLAPTLGPVVPGPTTNPGVPGPVTPTSTEPAPAGRSRTPAPTSRAPSTASGIADKVIGGAKSFLQGLFQ